MKNGHSLKAVTAKNRELYIAFHRLLDDNFSALKSMLEEDDFPVEVVYAQAHKTFHDADELAAYIRELGEVLDAA